MKETKTKHGHLHILQLKIKKKITNLFKHTNLEISLKNTNTLQQFTKLKIDGNIREQDKSGSYEVTCNICRMSYIGQTSRSLKQRYQEHISYIKHNESQSAYALLTYLLTYLLHEAESFLRS